jgi:hypothetical protein
MDNNNVLAHEVSDVYQKTLMSVSESSPSVSEMVDNDFINNFIMYFHGSKLDNVFLDDVSNERCRQTVKSLFKEIEKDLYNARNSTVDVLGFVPHDLDILRMYIDGRTDFDDSVKTALYNVQNMAGVDSDAAAVLNQVYEKQKVIQAYKKSTGETYDVTTREGIRNHFLGNGIIEETTNQKGKKVDVIVSEEMQSRPSEVEKLMNDLSRIVDKSSTVNDIEDCKWVGGLSVSGYKVGRPIAELSEPDSPIVHATEACRRVAEASKDRYNILRENIVSDTETSLVSTGDKYMRFIFGMIQNGKISKDASGQINIVDIEKITPNDIVTLCKNVKRAMFQLGPNDSDENKPVQFVETFDMDINQIKHYIDFINSNDLNPVIAKDTGKKDDSIKANRTRISAAYILIKAVHDVFDGCIMKYSKTDSSFGGYTIPSFKKFCSAIDANCGEYPNLELDRNYIFNYKIMFSTDYPYFPIEHIIKQNPNMYHRMCNYRKSCIEAYTAQAMEIAAKNMPVEDTSHQFVERFNRVMHGIAQVDKYCDNLKLSTMISSIQFADAFNTVSDGIAYAARNDVNDKETEYKLWSILKTLANNTPSSLGNEVKQEFINVAHIQEDIMFRMDIAVKAGVVSRSNGFHFSGNFGTLENGKNKQATRIDRIMKIFYAYVSGLLFIHTNDALGRLGYTKPMNMNLVKPYLRKIYDIAKEYNIEFNRNNARDLGCSKDWSDKIVSTIETYSMGGNNVS